MKKRSVWPWMGLYVVPKYQRQRGAAAGTWLIQFHVPKRLRPPEFPATVDLPQARPYCTGPDDLACIMAHWRQLHGPTVRRLALDAGTFDARPHLESIRVPTLILCGDRDVFAPPEKVALPMRAAMPQASFVRLPHGTHSSTLEHTDDVRAALLAFLAGIRAA